MRTNKAAIKLIKEAEALKLTAYPDPASDLAKACYAKKISIYDNKYKALPGWESMKAAPWTVGYGSTGPDVKAGTVWTVAQCEDRFMKHLEEFENGILAKVKIPLNDNQLSALVSLCYNMGLGVLNSDRSVGMKILAKDYQGIADAFLLYNKAGKPAVVLPGLVKRRAAERELFLTPIVSAANSTPARNSSAVLPEGPSEEDIRKMLGEVESKILNK